MLLVSKILKELDASSLVVKGAGLHPGVGSDLLNGRADVSVVSEKPQDQVLEVLTQVGAVDLVEVSIDLTLHKQVVEVFLLAGFLEGKDALNNNEEDHTD